MLPSGLLDMCGINAEAQLTNDHSIAMGNSSHNCQLWMVHGINGSCAAK